MHAMNPKESGLAVTGETARAAVGNASDSTGRGAGMSPGADPDVCPQCGQLLSGGGLEQFFRRLGISTEMIDSLKGQFENVDIDEYLNTAREYLKDGGDKAQTYAKENPGKVAAGVAALALGAGLIWSQCQTVQELEDRSRQLELRQALRGRKYGLDEVLRELDAAV